MRRTIFKSVVCALGVAGTIAFESYASAQTASHLNEPPGVHVLPALAPLPTTPNQTPVSSLQPASLSVPVFSSRPSANAKIFLDFDGDVTDVWGSYTPGTTPAYDTDGDPTTFSDAELENIRQIWSAVSEAYSPFNIDVTTVNPGTLIDRKSMRIVIGGDGKNGADSYWVGSRAGGIGYVGGFTNSQPNTVYVFPGNLRNGTPRFVAMAAAHESGHAFNLQHHSEYDGDVRVQEYSDNDPDTTGDGTGHYSAQPTAPFMGVSYFATRPIWFNGPGTSAYDNQDDLAILSNSLNGFGYRADDHGNTVSSATPLTMVGLTATAAGVIEQIMDRDLFRFVLDADSTVMFTVDGAPYNAMLDPSLALYDANDNVIELVDTPDLSETLTDLLTSGTYAIGVLSAGNYGDIGQYTLTGSIIPVVAPEPAISTTVLAGFMLLRRRTTVRRRIIDKLAFGFDFQNDV